MESEPEADLSYLCEQFKSKRQTKWINIGGQLVIEKDLDQLRLDIGKGKLDNWEDIHSRYDDLWERYQFDKQNHAFATLLEILGTDRLTNEQWMSALDRAVDIQKLINERVYISRKKDFDNKFRQNTYRNIAEMTAAIGTIEDNGFVKEVRKETEDFKKLVDEIRKRNSQ